MDIHEPRLGFPSALFLYGSWALSIEMHCHCSSCPQRVTADIGWLVSKDSLIQPKVISCYSESPSDVDSCDMSRVVSGVVEGANAGLSCATIGLNVVDAPSKGLDGTVLGACAFLIDALTFDSILLIGDAHCCFICG